MIIDFSISGDLIVASHIAGIYDVNRNTILDNDDFAQIADWARSITALGLQGIIFHNNFSEATCKLHQSEHLHFVKVDYNPLYNPNVFRYFIYAAFLKLYSHKIKNIFFTDISDVIVLKNPFQEKLYQNNLNAIFCGDEPTILDNDWMKEHSQHFRNKIPDYVAYETKYKNEILLNCGIMGGSISVMHPFIEELALIHQQYSADNKTAYTGDMGAFNYLIRTRYNSKVINGYPVNTIFKNYSDDLNCWFKHK